MSVFILGYHQILSPGFVIQEVSQIENLSFFSGELPEEVSKAVLLLSSEKLAFYIAGTTLNIDGGLMF